MKEQIRSFLPFAFVILMMSVTSSLKAKEQPVDELLRGWHLASSKSKLECNDLDELGGQPPITSDIKQDVDAWAKKALPDTPQYYIYSVPKRNLAQDVLAKQRQDKVLERLRELRMMIMDAYGQSLALGIDTTDFIQISTNYCEIVSSKYWKNLGDRYPKKAWDAGKWLHFRISIKGMEDVESVYAKILAAKKVRYQDFAAKHPETAQTALAIQRAKKAELRAAAAEDRAQQAEWAAAAAGQAAEWAAAEAREAQQRADAANRRAADAQFQLDTGMHW